MQKKLKLQRFMVFTLAFIIVLIVISIALGRGSSVEIVVVSKEGIDTTKTLGDQRELFKSEKISKSAYDTLGGTVLLYSDFEKVQTQKPKFSFVVDTPILKSMLTNDPVGGEKASTIGQLHTIQKLPSSVPAGAVAGDRIDIILLYDSPATKTKKSGVLMKNVLIDSVQPDGAYVSVSQSAALRLTMAQDLGTFVLQLPGTKQIGKCTPEQLESRDLEGIECYTEEDAPTQMDAGSIIEELENQKDTVIVVDNKGTTTTDQEETELK